MNQPISKFQAVNWNRGLHRVFALLCVLWAGYLLVWLPMQEVKRATTYAAETYNRWQKFEQYEITPKSEQEKSAELKENWERATWSYVYREHVGGAIGVILGMLILVPAIGYGFIRVLLMLILWLYRGFKTPKEEA